VTVPEFVSPELSSLDVASMELGQLRGLRSRLQAQDDVVSYIRRIAQARCDVVAARFLEVSPNPDITGDLGAILAAHLTGGPARPPRPVEPVDEHPLLDRLEQICADHGYSRAEELEIAELHALVEAITAFEREVSQDRQARFEVLDALSAELVRRYRNGEANVDSLLESGELESGELESGGLDSGGLNSGGTSLNGLEAAD
jgi:hypothetical protein